MDLFFLVPKIIAAEKYIDINRDEIERAITSENGEFEWEWEEVIVDEFGNEHYVPLRLNIHCRSEYALGWSVAIKLHSIRIDGIDWHSRFFDPQGIKREGWHRHEFNQHTKSAAEQRVPIDGLDDDMTVEQFLTRTLSRLRISLSGVDHGNYELFRSADISD